MVVLLFVKGTFGILKTKSDSYKTGNHDHPRGIILLDHNYSVKHPNDAKSFYKRSKLPLLLKKGQRTNQAHFSCHVRQWASR